MDTIAIILYLLVLVLAFPLAFTYLDLRSAKSDILAPDGSPQIGTPVPPSPAARGCDDADSHSFRYLHLLRHAIVATVLFSVLTPWIDIPVLDLRFVLGYLVGKALLLLAISLSIFAVSLVFFTDTVKRNWKRFLAHTVWWTAALTGIAFWVSRLYVS